MTPTTNASCDPGLHNEHKVPASFLVRLWLEESDKFDHGLKLTPPSFSFDRSTTFACCTKHLGHAVQILMVTGTYLDGRSKITVNHT